MPDSGENAGETGIPNSGSAAFAPLEAWSQWLRNNMGTMSASPGSNGEEEAEAVPEGATPSDPLISAMGKLSDNPMSNIIPIDWMEISKALQTLHTRQMSDPQRTKQVATDYNRRLEEAMVKVWNDAASRFWGLPRQEEEEEEEETGKPDKRFSDPEWESNPYYKMLKEMYLLTSEYILKEAEETDDGQDTEEQQRLKFHLKQFVDAIAPVNFFHTNPAAIRRAVETGGMSLVDGARNLASDLEKGRLSMVDSEAFEVGGNLATSSGKVVYRNELIELIQYEPQTERVHEVPILFIPPWINKYYILDLSEKNSLVKYLVEHGFTVFMISWKNPDSSMDETKFEDYMTLGPLKAIDVIREITGSENVNPVGYCIGGTLLIVTLAWLAASDDEEEKQKFGDPTFMVSLQDYSEVGDTEVFIDEPQVEFMEMQMMERGYLDERKMANMFNLLRSCELIWANVINNYLLGQKPPALDMLYWNSDGTRLARDAHSFYIRNTYLENNLIKPGEVELMGRPIDLGRITGDIYAVGAEKDHIVPWKSAWKISKLANTNTTRFTLAASGHIAGMIAPPEKGKGYWTGEDGQYETAEEWRESAEEHEGTWWEDWRGWLQQRSGEQTDPPRVGSEQYRPIEDAPGTYVRETSTETVREAGQEGTQVAQESVGAYIFSCSESAARQIRTYHRRKGAKVRTVEHWNLKRRAQLHSGEIAYDVFGSGPSVILVHGTPRWSYIWRKVVPVLSDRFTVYVCDLLGYGKCEPSEGQDVSIAVHARVLAELVDRWGLEAPAVAGHDIGGATVLCAHLLERVPFSRMALIDAVALRPWVTEASQHVQEHLDAYRTMPNHIFEEVVAAHLRTTVSSPMDEKTFNTYMAQWRGPEGQEAYLRKVERFDEQHTKEFEPLLGSIGVPVRIIWGEEDAWLAPAFARELQELMPGSELYLIPEAGHFSIEDQPDAVAGELADFFG